MSDSISRRNFIAGTVAAGAASMVGAANAQAQETHTANRKLRIGVIGVSKQSFMTYSWADIIEGTKPGSPRGNYGMPLLNMELTHVWDPDEEAARQFAERLDMVHVKNFDDMLGHIDGLIFAGMVDTPYMKTLAKPYLEAGVPTYLTRPFAYSLRDIDEILDSAAKGSAPIIATAKYEHYREISALRNKIKNVGNIRSVQAVGNTIDFPMHFHLQFMMLKILGYDVEQVSLFYDHETRANYVHETYLYPGSGDQQPFVCTIDGSRIPDSFHINVYGDNGNASVSMERGYDTWQENLLHRYAPQVIDMQRTFYGENFEPYDIVRKKTEIYLTAFYSRLERGGAPVKVGTVPADWRVQTPNIDTNATIDV